MTRTLPILFIGAVLWLQGCATAPSASDLQSADYGARPMKYEQTVRDYFDSALKDPSSIQYREITAPEHGWIRDPVMAGNQLHYGWRVSATVNAKNSYGGYVGFKTYLFLFRGEQIVDTITPDDIVR